MRVVTLKVSDKMYSVLKDLAEKQGVSVSELIRDALNSIDDLNLLRFRKMKTISFTVDEDFYNALHELARVRGVSVSQLIKETLLLRYDFLKRYVSKPPRRSKKKEIIVKRYVLY